MLFEKYDFSKVPEFEIANIIYPSSWYDINDIEIKIEALKEAIEYKITLLETDTINKYFNSL